MKKYLYLSMIICSVFCSAIKVQADCYTGFACSLSDLEEKESIQMKQNYEFVKNYFNKNIMPDSLAIKAPKSQYYKDLFLFNTIF